MSSTRRRSPSCSVVCTGPLFAYAMALMLDRAAAEEVVQRAFELACRERRVLRLAIGSPDRWLFAITCNVALDERRRARRRATVAASAGPLEDGGPDVGLERADRRSVVFPALRSLDRVDREVIALKFWADLSNGEIGAVLACSESTSGRVFIVRSASYGRPAMTPSDPFDVAHRARADLAAVDAALASGRVTADDPDERSLQSFALGLRAAAPRPRVAFTETLDRRLREQFARAASARIKVLVAAGRSGARADAIGALQRDSAVDVVGEVSDGSTALELARRLEPDVVVLAHATSDPGDASIVARVRDGRTGTQVVAVAADPLGALRLLSRRRDALGGRRPTRARARRRSGRPARGRGRRS